MSVLSFLRLSPPLSSTTSTPPRLQEYPSRHLACLWKYGAKDRKVIFGCCARSKLHTHEFAGVFHKDTKRQEFAKDDVVRTEDDTSQAGFGTEEIIKGRVELIKSMLGSMEDGEISISPYDTAWVALVEDVDGAGLPQFPSSIQWIAKNQLADGSWGDREIFLAHDRIINTLACVIALKSWNVYPEACSRGMRFIEENIHKLEGEKDEHLPVGFEVAFPSLVEIARKREIRVVDNSPFLKEIYDMRDLKLTRIPKDIMHNAPTTLLHSLEGMTELEWKKLLNLQCSDGSFLFSPSSTAFALSQTKDPNCLRYLKKAVEKFNGGVPNVYPVDMFEHLWAVDRLRRLGVSHYFQKEIKECLDYVYRYWTGNGICWARNTRVQDIDDTAMAFRLLRLYGYDVSADAFGQFERDREFVCFAGQSNQAVTGIYNLYRASQAKFPGEEILERAEIFCSKFLRQKQACDQLLDKWIITKDLPGEVGYALDIPWYANLPRVEARFYIDQYGGENDVWIGKTLYRMPYVNNNAYLELAKLDFNNCQAMHQLEWDSFHKWYVECNLGRVGVSERDLLLAYFLAAASIYEPEKSNQRMAWAKSLVLMDAIFSYISTGGLDSRQQPAAAFVNKFQKNVTTREYLKINGRRWDSNNEGEGLVATLLGTLNQLSLDVLVAHGRRILSPLCHIWENWLMRLHGEGEDQRGELLVQTINIISGGRLSSEGLLSYQCLMELTNRICRQLQDIAKIKAHDKCKTAWLEINRDMRELVQLVLLNSSEDGSSASDADFKQAFFTVARSFYYTAHCNSTVIDFHISKVLFERVE